MARVTYQMDQAGTAPLLTDPALRRVLGRRAEAGAAAARRETAHKDRVTVRQAGVGNGQWSDRAAVNIEGPPGTLDAAVAAVERGDRG